MTTPQKAKDNKPALASQTAAAAAAQDQAPIFVACEEGALEALDALLAGKNRKTLLTTFNSLGRYPIHVAALSGRLPVVERLIKAGADINQLENRVSKWSVLHHAAHSKSKEVFYFAATRENLLPETVKSTNRDQNTPLHYYCRFFTENYKNVINLLVEKGAEVNAQNVQGETPLHNSCWYGHLEIVQSLLDLGADPNKQTVTSKETALHWAARLKSPDAVAALLKAGADPLLEGTSGTALQVAQSEAIRALLEAKVKEKKTAGTTSSQCGTACPPAAPINADQARAIVDKTRRTPFPWEIKFDDIKLGDPIGEGGFGIVYKGTWKGLDVAIKMLVKKGSKDPLPAATFDSLMHEISILSKLRNTNILLFLGACLDFPNVCVVTELMPHNLHDLIQKERIDRSKKLSMAIEITKALQYLHCNSPPLLHRDLKTMNLLVDDNYHIKMADFGAVGLAKAIQAANTETEALVTPGGEAKADAEVLQKQHGTTLFCLAPEVLVDHKPYTAESDIYALSMIFYELFVEKMPFEGQTAVKLMRAVDKGEMPRIPDSLQPGLKELITRCWDKDVSKRPTLDEILDILRKASKSKDD